MIILVILIHLKKEYRMNNKKKLKNYFKMSFNHLTNMNVKSLKIL